MAFDRVVQASCCREPISDGSAHIHRRDGGEHPGPLATEAQQAWKVYRIGWFALSQPTNPEIAALHDAVLQELRAQGFVEGQNVRIDRRYTEGREERATALAAELVSMKVDLIFATYSGLVRAAKEATSTIPIVMGAVANPERQGLIASLARPGGNVTGTSSIGAESGAKLLQIAKDALPQRSRLAILWNPNLPISALSVRETEVPAATALGMPPILVGGPKPRRSGARPRHHRPRAN